MRAGSRGEQHHVFHDHISPDIRADDMEAFASSAKATRTIDLPRTCGATGSDIFTDKYKRLGWDALCRTITAHIAKDGYWYIHPEQHRTLSIREAARIQTLPGLSSGSPATRPIATGRSATLSHAR